MKKTILLALILISTTALISCTQLNTSEYKTYTPDYRISYKDISDNTETVYVYDKDIHYQGGAIDLHQYYVPYLLENKLTLTRNELIISSGRWIIETNHRTFKSKESTFGYPSELYY